MAGRVALLDVNVLVALFLPDHIHHETAHDWFADRRHLGWATCPLTINGLVRVACRIGGEDPLRPETVLAAVQKFCKDKHHHAWPDDARLSDDALFARGFLKGPAQVTDVYLLGLAKLHDGCLATFDRSIPLPSVHGASTAHLELIGTVSADDDTD